MARQTGITETFWAAFPEDRRLLWKYLSRGLALLSGLFLVRTGNIVIDWTLAALTTVFASVVLETERSYSRLSPRVRKANVRIAIGLGSWSLALLGVLYFAQAAIGAVATVYLTEIAGNIDRAGSPAVALALLCIFAVAVPVAVIRVFRQLHMEELIYQLPRTALKKLLIYKTPKASCLASFAHFELSVLLGCVAYSSIFAALLQPIVLV